MLGTSKARGVWLEHSGSEWGMVIVATGSSGIGSNSIQGRGGAWPWLLPGSGGTCVVVYRSSLVQQHSARPVI